MIDIFVSASRNPISLDNVPKLTAVLAFGLIISAEKWKLSRASYLLLGDPSRTLYLLMAMKSVSAAYVLLKTREHNLS